MRDIRHLTTCIAHLIYRATKKLNVKTSKTLVLAFCMIFIEFFLSKQ